MIKIQGLTKSYGSNIVLRDESLKFEAGQIYGIVGENGAGKTTLFRCMAGLESYSGSISSSLTPFKNHLGLLLAESYFFSKITGKEYIRLLCNARSIDSNDIEGKNIFDLPLDQYASTYSTGMKKKLALTAILLQHNDYFILDEPFNGVDIQSNIVFTEIIKELKSLGKTIIISSHIFSSLSELADRIYLLRKGEHIRSVEQSEFKALEAEMKEVTVGSKIERLGLR